MHTNSVIKKLLKIEKIVIENMYFDDTNNDEIFVVKVRPVKRELNRCPKCGKSCPGYTDSKKIRRWRSLDFGSQRVYIEANSPRIKCSEHGVIVARVPWARYDSDFTYDFETAVTWFALHACASDVSEYFRIKWDTVGSIVKKVQDTLEKLKENKFDNLEEIGIDETSYKKGHKYMTVVVNHKTGGLIWAKKGHGKEVLTAFFKEMTEEQRAKIKLVSADGARWIADCITEFCHNAQRCIDPFHVVMWANDCLDEVRNSAIREAKKDATEGKTVSGGKKKFL
jgi:transposase